MNILSIDIGVKNFAFTFHNSTCNTWNCNLIDFKSLYIDEKINVNRQLQDKRVTKSNSKPKKAPFVNIIKACIKFIFDYKSFFDVCDHILIEEQLALNPEARTIFCCISSLLYKDYRDKVITMHSSFKTKINDMEKLSGKKARKRETINYVLNNNILDSENLKSFKALRKKDDIADTICMIVFFKNQNA